MHFWHRTPYLEALKDGLLEAVSIGKGFEVTINHHRLRLSPRWWRAFPPDYENDCFAFVAGALHPGDVAFDVGSHVGIYSLVMAELVAPDGKVIAFEPNPVARRFLERHVRLNRFESVIAVEPLAVAAEAGEATLYAGPETADSGSSADPGSSLYAQDHLTTNLSVDVTDIDSYCSKMGVTPGLIKIDVEGYECSVMRGARRTLAASDVQVLCEVHVDNMRMIGETPDGLLEIVESVGYGAFDLNGNRLDSINRSHHAVFRRVRAEA